MSIEVTPLSSGQNEVADVTPQLQRHVFTAPVQTHDTPFREQVKQEIQSLFGITPKP